ncbi:Glutamate--tRNA ligase mitochondrial [Ceratobasidium sp. 414]|nr:Glutamate--tRNA ligase mitochondrial [Ceratobasidium sp. 414]
MARKLQGEWVLRIEDTDRVRPDSYQARSTIFGEGSSGLELNTTMSERLDLYHQYAKKLLDSGHAYRCFCDLDKLAETKKKLQKLGSNSTYDRACLNLSEEETARRYTSITEAKPEPDLIFGTSVQHTHAGLPTDPVLLKTDLFPTYHLASVVDDTEMEITHVLRGEEWLPTLPLHLDLYLALGLKPPQFGHLPLLLNPDGTKMSKRKGDVRVRDYMVPNSKLSHVPSLTDPRQEKGWEPEAVVNWLALAGWNVHRQLDPAHKHEPSPETAKSPKDVLTLAQLIESFDVSHLTHRRNILDPKKLEFLNRQHIMRKVSNFSNQDGEDETSVAQRAAKIIREAYPGIEPQYCSAEYVTEVLRVLSDRVVILSDVATAAPYFFAPPDYTSDAAKSLRKTVKEDLYPRALQRALEELENVPLQDEKAVHAVLDKIRTDLGVGTMEVMNTIRHALTGRKVGPSVVETLKVLGWSRSEERFKDALKREV